MIEILLSTYNGENHIKELILSILNQTYTDWRLIIRDDVSNDSTLQIIEYFKKKYPDKITLMETDNDHLGPVLSFGRLLGHSQADYISLCDQDDIWMPDKLEILFHNLSIKEKQTSKDLPILVHSDLQVCNENMEKIADSFWKYQNLDPEKMKDIRCLLVQNFVTGCTLMINKALLEKALPIPCQTLMVDWWLALLAQQTGEILTINIPLVKYRQHGNNVIGARKWGRIKLKPKELFKKINSYKGFVKMTGVQAGVLLNYIPHKTAKDIDLIAQYSKLYDKPWIIKKVLYISLGIKKYGWVRQILTWCCV